MLDKEQPDILDICTPTYLHKQMAVLALNRSINVLLEKPASLQQAEITEIYAAARRNKVQVMTAQVVRFWPEYEYLREVIQSGVYGKVLSGRLDRLTNRPKASIGNWMLDPQRSGLVLFDMHIHDVDYMVSLFGAPEQTDSYRKTTAQQDFLHVIYRYEDFFIETEAAWFDCGYPFRAGFRFQFEHAVIEFGDELTVYTEDGRQEVIQAAGSAGASDPDAFYNEINYFYNCVKDGVQSSRVPQNELETVNDILTNLKDESGSYRKPE